MTYLTGICHETSPRGDTSNVNGYLNRYPAAYRTLSSVRLINRKSGANMQQIIRYLLFDKLRVLSFHMKLSLFICFEHIFVTMYVRFLFVLV